MPNKYLVKPEVKNYEMHLTNDEINIGDAIQDTPNGEQESGITISADDGASIAHVSATNPLLAVIKYRPTLYGRSNKKKIITAFEDFYNKVTGSALTSNTISTADLVLFNWLGKEWRAFIKDLDRGLTIYNQTTYLNLSYGKLLIDKIYGDGTYVRISAHSNQLLKFRNQLAKRINQYFPLMKGLKWTAIDDLALDNIYCDDPDAKSALIAFSRQGYVVKKTSDVLAKFETYKFWTQFNTYTENTEDALVALFDEVLTMFDDLVQDIWFTDVRPYIQNLISKGGFHEDSGIEMSYEDKIANREWTPVYSSEIIDLIRNCRITGDGMWNAYSFDTRSEKEEEWNPDLRLSGLTYTTIQEDEEGCVVCNENVKPWLIPTKFGSKVDKLPKNLESYPACNQAFIKAIIFDEVRVRKGSSADYLVASGPAEIVKISYYFMEHASNGELRVIEKYLISNAVFMTDASITMYNTDIPPAGYTEFNLTLARKDIISLITRFNAVPVLLTMDDISGTAAISAPSILEARVRSSSKSGLIVDLDNIIVPSDAMLVNAYRRMAYDSVYNPDSVQGVAGKTNS